ncbi:hypothetical protein ACFQO8_02860 [Exiguobacterium aestuarii]|uniref:DUF3592 domain-containing protein n=1 Tax=Exiguobacterium aestuarii TaxID=273527 RepID=A0ABW2PJ15_9BACL|nr:MULTISPECIES: hypothetical protein [Exiguobacterium]MCT4785912.1 hypothetical protein [Exiguobacterium aestuarii]
MRRLTFLTLFALSIALPVSALSWAYTFVVFERNVYEVLDTTIDEDSLGDVIGEVETTVNDETGRYYGNASNGYPIGTAYREIDGEAVEDVIAVEDGSEWKRAEYRFRAPYHTSDFIKFFGYALLVLGIVLVSWTLFKRSSLYKKEA